MANSKHNSNTNIVQRAKDLSNSKIKAGARFSPYHVVLDADAVEIHNIISFVQTNKYGVLGFLKDIAKDAGTYGKISELETILFSLDYKSVIALSDIVSKVSLCEMNAQAYKKAGKLEYETKYSELSQIYQKAIEEMWGHFENVYYSKAYNAKEIEGAWTQMDNDKPSKEDIELAQAFEQVGVTLKFEGGQWEVDKTSKSGIKRTVEEMYGFSAKDVNNLLDGYLNKDAKDRGQYRITPEGLFKVFQERTKDNISKDSRIKDDELLQLSLKNELVDLTRSKLTTKNSAWKVSLLTNPEMMKKNAMKVALAGFSQGLIANDSTNTIPEYSNELKEMMENSTMYDSSNDKRDIVGRLLSRAIKDRNYVVEHMPGAELDSQDDGFAKFYDEMMGKLNKELGDAKQNNSSEQARIQEQLDQIKVAKEQFEANVTFIQKYVSELVKSGKLTKKSEDVIDQLQTAVDNYWLVKSKGGDFIMQNEEIKEYEHTEAFKVFRDHIINKKENQNNSNNTSTNTEMTEDQLNDKFNWLGANLSDMQELQFVELMFAPGGMFDESYKEYVKALKENYPEKKPTIEDFYENLKSRAEKEGGDLSFTKEIFVAGYERAMKKQDASYTISNGSNEYINGIEDRFDYTIVLLDRAIRRLTPQELEEYNNAQSEADRLKILKPSIKKALKDKTPFTETESKTALLKHKNNKLRNMIKEQVGAAAESMPDGEKFPEASAKIIDKYLQDLDAKQAQNEDALKQQTQQKPAETDKDAEEEKKKTEWKKYSDFRPSSSDKDKFEKAMKKYAMKDIKKHFLKPLLKAIKGIKINVTAMNESAQSQNNDNNNSNPTPPQTPQADNTNESASEETQQEESVQENIENKPNEIQKNKSILRQVEYEASAFLPGVCLIDRAMNDIKKSEGLKSDQLEPLECLRAVIKMLSTVDDKGNIYTNKNESGASFRDDARSLALDICRGKITDGNAVGSHIEKLAQQYSIPKDDQFLQTIQSGFAYLTPELMNYLFEFSSISKKETSSEGQIVNKIDLGTRLPRGLDKCSNDKEREELVRQYMNNNLTNFNEGSQLFNMLVNDIYSKGGYSTGFGRGGDLMEFDM